LRRGLAVRELIEREEKAAGKCGIKVNVLRIFWYIIPTRCTSHEVYLI